MARAPVSLEKARAAKSKALRKLSGMPGMNGVGITRRGKSFALKVNFEERPEGDVPSEIDGVDVITEVVGRITKRGAPKPKRSHHVVALGEGWAVRSGSRATRHETQREAIEAARKLARRTSGEVVVHRRDGSVRRRYEAG